MKLKSLVLLLASTMAAASRMPTRRGQRRQKVSGSSTKKRQPCRSSSATIACCVAGFRWLQAPRDSPGRLERDTRNPESGAAPARTVRADRHSATCDRVGPNHLRSDGWFYYPESGKTYNVKMELTASDALVARFYLGTSFGRRDQDPEAGRSRRIGRMVLREQGGFSRPLPAHASGCPAWPGALDGLSRTFRTRPPLRSFAARRRAGPRCAGAGGPGLVRSLWPRPGGGLTGWERPDPCSTNVGHHERSRRRDDGIGCRQPRPASRWHAWVAGRPDRRLNATRRGPSGCRDLLQRRDSRGLQDLCSSR